MVHGVGRGVARVLLFAASLGFSFTVVCGLGWWWTARGGGISIETLTSTQRRQLVDDLLNTSPGVFRPALFSPRVGYTLKPRVEINEWNATFLSNELGYRSGPVRKGSGVFRVVFVGDSWTFGMGVDEAQAFPHQFELLANAYSGCDRRVESWSLALPGYNILNETSALESFYGLLKPDAVVFCPTNNDVDSGDAVLPNGSLSKAPLMVDGFGFSVPVTFHSLFLNSHLYQHRWRYGMDVLGALSERLRERSVPALVFFTGRWISSFAHNLISEAEIDLPYVITPDELSSMKWRNPPPFFHPNPEAHQEYARMIYRGFAPELGWHPMQENRESQYGAVQRRFDQTRDWSRQCETDLRAFAERNIQTDFVPSLDRALQVGVGVDLRTGNVGRGAVVFIRKAAGSRNLVLSLRGIPEADFIYPLEVTVAIPSGVGSHRQELILPARGAEIHRFPVDIPHDIREGVVMEIIIETEAIAVTTKNLSSASLSIVKIDQ